MKKHNLAFIDIETTGLNVLEHEIIQIGIILTTPRLKIIEEFEIKIKPEKIEKADPIALKINHYSEEKWENALNQKEAIKLFSEKVKNCIMVGQNVSFDSNFLEYTLAQNNLINTMHYHKLDTISISWAKLHRKKSLIHFSLREMCKKFGIKNEKAHDALSDARATYELYKKLMSL
jgi:DNA polymerase-3 subunit epsilon